MSVCSVEFVPRYIKTSGNATVDHLSKYLAVRLALEELRRNSDASPVNVEAASEKQYTIYIPTAGNQFTVSTHTYMHTLGVKISINPTWISVLTGPEWLLFLGAGQRKVLESQQTHGALLCSH